MENIKTCKKCGATWRDGQHYWSTGARGNEIDLNSLVCAKYGNDDCINPCRNSEIQGQTWEDRAGGPPKID